MIPILNVAQCKARGGAEGVLDFSYDPPGDLLDIPFVAFQGPIEVHLAYRIAEDDSVEVQGSIAFTLTGACSRCLEPASEHISYEVEALFEKGEGDGETYGYRGGIVNFGEMLRDAVLFALPSRLLCEECSKE